MCRVPPPWALQRILRRTTLTRGRPQDKVDGEDIAGKTTESPLLRCRAAIRHTSVMPLVPDGFCRQTGMMRRWQFRQAYVLMLGLLVALGMSLSAVQASNMAAGMVMSSHQMAANGTGNCNGCNDGPGAAKIMMCDAACVAPATATVPQSPALLIEGPVNHPLSQSPTLSGWTASPNPHPPKFIAHS